MTAETMPKPGKGRPKTEAQKAEVLALEQEVVKRHAVAGQSFYRIDRDLGITNSHRIYKRAMEFRPVVERAAAAQVQRARLDALHEKAWEALSNDGLDTLAERVAAYMHDYGDEADAQAIRAMIGSAYADTYKAVPVALQVHDRFVKLDGLDHAARVADAGLAIEAAKLRIMADVLAKALLHVSDPVEREAVLVTFGRELEAVQTEGEDE